MLTDKQKEWLEKVVYGECTAGKDDVVDVDGSVQILPGSSKTGTQIQVQFGDVSGDFKIEFRSTEEFTDLTGCPHSVGGDFIYKNSNAKSLRGGPRYVGGCFDVRQNKLESLEFSPEYVGETFRCAYNKITSLSQLGPITIKGNFNCISNRLRDLNFKNGVIIGGE